MTTRLPLMQAYNLARFVPWAGSATFLAVDKASATVRRREASGKLQDVTGRSVGFYTSEASAAPSAAQLFQQRLRMLMVVARMCYSFRSACRELGKVDAFVETDTCILPLAPKVLFV